jgi:hypothetical protein
VTSCGRLAFLAIALTLAPHAPPANGQTLATLGVGASIIEYDGFLSSGAAVVAPSIRFETASFTLGGQASWTAFESGNKVWQAAAAASWLAPQQRWWRLELAGSVGASKYADQDGDGHGLAGARLHVFGERTGGWVGATTGAQTGGSNRAPVELAVAGWTVRNHLSLVGTLTSTWIGGDRHVDLLGVARWSQGGVELEVRAGARPWVTSDGGVGDPRTGAYGEVSAAVAVGGRVALAVSGGSYASDPVRRVLAAKHVSVGLRVRLAGSAGAVAPRLGAAAAHRTGAPAPPAGAPRLEVAPADAESHRTLRVHAPGARAVELMGDFTDWRAVSLALTGAGAWEIRLPLAAGVYRINVRVNGGEWVVPGGTRLEGSEFGGAVGLLVVH